MSIWLDLEYATKVAHLLPRFAVKQTNPYLANFRCVFCGDSEKSKTKARGYLFSKPGGLFFRCHNCGFSCNMKGLIEHVDQSLLKSYNFDSFREAKGFRKHHIKDKHERAMTPTTKTEVHFQERLLDKMLDRLDKLDDEHPAVQYCLMRSIPRSQFHRLYFIDETEKLENLSEKYHDKIVGSEPRIVIPIYDQSNRLVAITARAIEPDCVIRYLLLKINEDRPHVFGLELYDPSEQGYVLEGPIDSLFLPNAIATCNADLARVSSLVNKANTTFIFDNQPRNKHLIRSMNMALKQGLNVFVWPDYLSEEEKDIAALVQSGMAVEQLLEIISTHTYKGIAARAAIQKWRRCDT